MSDIHALSGAYAVDAVDDLERARFERHLAGCESCREEVDSLRGATALIAETTAVPPPAGLRDRVLAEIATVRPLPPQVDSPTASSASVRRRRLAPLLAAAAAVVAVGAGASVWAPWEDTGSQQVQVLGPIDRVLQAEDAERYTKAFPDGSTATLVRSRELNQAVVVTDDMKPAPAGKTYQLWLQHEDDGMVPAGLMLGKDTLLLTGDPANAIGAGITVEPDTGSRVPTTDPVALFTFEQA